MSGWHAVCEAGFPSTHLPAACTVGTSRPLWPEDLPSGDKTAPGSLPRYSGVSKGPDTQPIPGRRQSPSLPPPFPGSSAPKTRWPGRGHRSGRCWAACHFSYAPRCGFQLTQRSATRGRSAVPIGQRRNQRPRGPPGRQAQSLTHQAPTCPGLSLDEMPGLPASGDLGSAGRRS